MNILLLNQTWFADELRAMGHTVLTCGTAHHLEHRLTGALHHIDGVLASLPGGFTPDRIVWLDNSAPVTIMGLEDCDIPILFYSVDTHHHYDLHSHLAECFDHVLIAQKDFMRHFESSQTPRSWMPLWAPEYVEKSFEKKFGATFVGTMNRNLNPARVDFFEALAKLIPIHVTQGAYATIFPHAEIIVNQTVKGDLNFRVFETMMCGALLLTERTGNGLFDIFEDGKHLVTYTPRDPQDAAAKVTELLNNTPAMRSIAEAGRAEILANHTMLHRALEIDRLLRSLAKRVASPRRHYAALMNASLVSLYTESVSAAISAEMSVVALNCAVRALRNTAAPNTIESQRVIKACLRHDRLTNTALGSQLLEEFAHAFPGNYLFSLLKVRALLNRGKRLEAEQFAQSFSSHPPEQIFSTAEHAVSLIME
jgi:hypothetical protein